MVRFFRFAWLLCVFVPLPVMGQVENATDARAVTPDQPVKPTPSLRLLASEPDLASLPRAPLATAVAQPVTSKRAEQANPVSQEVPSSAPSSNDPLSPDLVQQRIASLPTAPAMAPPAQVPRRASVDTAPLPNIIAKAMSLALAAPWLTMGAIGLLLIAVAGLFWRSGKRSRQRSTIDDTAPIEWAIAADSKEGLGKMLRAEREKAAQQARASRQRARFASLGQALIAMQADMQRSATRNHPRAADA